MYHACRDNETCHVYWKHIPLAKRHTRLALIKRSNAKYSSGRTAENKILHKAYRQHMHNILADVIDFLRSKYAHNQYQSKAVHRYNNIRTNVLQNDHSLKNDIIPPIQDEGTHETDPLHYKDKVYPTNASTTTHPDTGRGERQYPAHDRKERTRFRMNAVYKACGEDEQTIRDAL